MNLSLHLDDDLARRLSAMTEATGQSRNALIRKAIKEWLERQTCHRWPEEILRFPGLPDAVPFEDARAERGSS